MNKYIERIKEEIKEEKIKEYKEMVLKEAIRQLVKMEVK